ncbi:NUDIX hydrolase [Candidatus Kaiserbacteria bacterium]|nr:NUDIX hydrolase [Candidatus Kaiserbacteria bacterium]
MKRNRRALRRGVALIVVNPNGEVLVLKELEAKPDLEKYVGIYSIPMETVEKGESEQEALARLITEELGGLSVEIESKKRGFYWIAQDARASLYVGQTDTRDLRCPSKSGEVDGQRWESPREALKLWIRRGVREMLHDYLAGRRGVTCSHCRSVAPKS